MSLHNLGLSLCVFVVMFASKGSAQERPGVMGDLIKDIATVEAKVIALAETMPPSTYDWRPGKGVRSVAEVFVHIAGDNYFLPALVGATPPPDSRIDGKDNKTVVAFEGRVRTRTEIIGELKRSFGFLRAAMEATHDDALEQRPKNSVKERSTRATWIMTVTHLHEHLGQLIAYARSNGVTPPWSQ